MIWKLPDDWELPENELCYLKYKERGELYSMTKPDFEIAQPHLKNLRVVLDIGAHIGTTVVRYAKHFETVHAFEPVYYDILKRNIGHMDNIIIHPYAASNNTEEQIMFRSNKNSGCTLIKTKSNKKILQNSRFSKSGIVVKCIPIDSLNLTNVDFIKMDTEGFVLPVLQGMTETLKNSNYPIMLIEFNELNTNQKECRDFLNALGYRQFDNYDVDCFFKHKDY